MPTSVMANIRPLLERQIEGITPDVWAGCRFKRASGDCELRLQTFCDRDDGTRRFHVILGPLGSFRGAQWLDWNGGTGRLRDTLEVAVRYEVPGGDDGYLTFLDITATDQQALAVALRTDQADYYDEGGGGVVMDVVPNGTITQDLIARDDGTISAVILRYQYDLIVTVGEDI